MALITATKQVEQYGKALQMRSLDEYVVYKNAGLKPVMVNGKTALVQNIDLDFVSQLPDGTEVTNLVRMQKGYAPLDPATGKAYQLHHIGQKADGTLVILTVRIQSENEDYHKDRTLSSWLFIKYNIRKRELLECVNDTI